MTAATPGRAGDVLLDVVDLQVKYGAITAIKGISFDVREGEIVALLGANGAGRSPSTGVGSTASRRTTSSSSASATSPRAGTCSRG
jgi:ABC-type multidrug transport system ATPase subunit